MPQIILEYSPNVASNLSWNELFNSLHHLVHKETGVNIENCKSRAIQRDQYYIGKGGASNAFVHLQLALLSGRSNLQKKRLGEALLKVLEETFDASGKKLKLQITVELRDISREAYFKFPAGTFLTSNLT